MDCEGEIERVITKDELLCNIAVYWFTRSITSSTRIYYETFNYETFNCETFNDETFNGGDLPIRNQRIEVPTGCAIFPKEPIRFPRAWVERSYAVTHWSEMERGGHFAALEQPELFVEDLRAFFRGLR
jgi:pimeloyl-ACP methyl ester carboxylesterase